MDKTWPKVLAVSAVLVGTVMTVAFIQLRFFRDSYVTAFMSPSIVVTSYFP